MKVTVVAIHDQSQTGATLTTFMNQRLEQLAAELQQKHLKVFANAKPLNGDLVIYVSYTNKYGLKWRVVNDVAAEVEADVAARCAALGYVQWKTNTVNIFKGNQ